MTLQQIDRRLVALFAALLTDERLAEVVAGWAS